MTKSSDTDTSFFNPNGDKLMHKNELINFNPQGIIEVVRRYFYWSSFSKKPTFSQFLICLNY